MVLSSVLDSAAIALVNLLTVYFKEMLAYVHFSSGSACLSRWPTAARFTVKFVLHSLQALVLLFACLCTLLSLLARGKQTNKLPSPPQILSLIHSLAHLLCFSLHLSVYLFSGLILNCIRGWLLINCRGTTHFIHASSINSSTAFTFENCME